MRIGLLALKFRDPAQLRPEGDEVPCQLGPPVGCATDDAIDLTDDEPRKPATMSESVLLATLR